MLYTMWIAFKNDTALSELQTNLIRTRYDQVKDLPLHRTLVAKAVVQLEKQDNQALFLLFDQGFKELGHRYPLVLIYCLYPNISALYSRLGITETIRQATLSDVAIWVKAFEGQHEGTTGLDRYGWICRHLCAKVLRLGRLQFEQGFFRFPHSIYYDTKLSRYRTFTQDEVVFSSDGFIGEGPFRTTCYATDEHLFAHEVDQELGTISREAVEVPLSALELICTQDTPALFIHIPPGEPLTPPSADESFSLAATMFKPALFVCNSWLLDPELERILPLEGNIVRFSGRFMKFPVAFSVPQIYERVFGFGTTQADILAWECTTSLQRKVQSHIRGGGIFRTMGGYIPAPVL